MELYVKEECVYCQKVLLFLKEEGIEVTLRDIKENKNLTHLLNVGKKKQVPCLIAEDLYLYESEEILNYFAFLKGSSTLNPNATTLVAFLEKKEKLPLQEKQASS